MDGRHEMKNGTNGTTNGSNDIAIVADVPSPEEKRTLWQNVCHYWSYISVEPVMVAWLVPSCIALIAIQNLELQKVQFVEACTNRIHTIKMNKRKSLIYAGLPCQFR